MIVAVSKEIDHNRGVHVSELAKENLLTRNSYDWDIPGVVVFRGYVWSYETLIDFYYVDCC